MLSIPSHPSVCPRMLSPKMRPVRWGASGPRGSSPRRQSVRKSSSSNRSRSHCGCDTEDASRTLKIAIRPSPAFDIYPPLNLPDNKIYSSKPPPHAYVISVCICVGSAPLGSYTPQKVAINANFELGVTRSPTDGPTNGDAAGTTAAAGAATGAESLQYLKPATDEQTVAWSEGTRVTDLLF